MVTKKGTQSYFGALKGQSIPPGNYSMFVSFLSTEKMLQRERLLKLSLSTKH